MRRVIIESPLAGDRARNHRYLLACLRDSLMRGEAPFASHWLYAQPGVLDDLIPEERSLGMAAGFAWRRDAHATLLYHDLGFSSGMLAGREDAISLSSHVIEYRLLGGEWAAFGLSNYNDPRRR